MLEEIFQHEFFHMNKLPVRLPQSFLDYAAGNLWLKDYVKIDFDHLVMGKQHSKELTTIEKLRLEKKELGELGLKNRNSNK